MVIAQGGIVFERRLWKHKLGHRNDELNTRAFLALPMREIFVGKQAPLRCLRTQPTDHDVCEGLIRLIFPFLGFLVAAAMPSPTIMVAADRHDLRNDRTRSSHFFGNIRLRSNPLFGG